jgi:hypothetical protein
MTAVEAAEQVAIALGLGVREPRVLRATNNTVVWLDPSPVVAKVAPAPGHLLEWEQSVAVALERARAPVVGPSPLVPVQVHELGGWAVTFWPYHPQGGAPPSPGAIARALADLHEALGQVGGTEGLALPAWDIALRDVMGRLRDDGYATPLSKEDRDLLTTTIARHAEVAETSARHRALHGSPHELNILMVAGEPRFIDFETVCVGPVEWDLCHLAPPVADLYDRVDPEALAVSRLVVSAMTAALCWDAIERGEDMRFHAEHHLGVVRHSMGS